ncbi:DUF3667 domain-containing protein [Chryseobacterium sp. TY3]
MRKIVLIVDIRSKKDFVHIAVKKIQKQDSHSFLFTHFIEDLTHYDGQFWGTIKNLLCEPGKLTNTYLEGKRQMYVPPVKLYIFVSFLTFFVFAFFPTIDPQQKKMMVFG